jgi:hypothetical protein
VPVGTGYEAAVHTRTIVTSLALTGVVLLAGAGMFVLIGGRTETSAAIMTACLGWLLICGSRALSVLSRRRG